MKFQDTREIVDRYFQRFNSTPEDDPTLRRSSYSPSNNQLLFGPQIAVGAALGKSSFDFRIAVRLEHKAQVNSPRVTYLKKLAAGEVDIQVVGLLGFLTSTFPGLRERPVVPGGSIGVAPDLIGTLGFFAKERGGPDHSEYMVSNDHVLASQRSQVPSSFGEPVFQPGFFDGGSEDDVVGFHSWQRQHVDSGNKSGSNVDAAYAKLLDGIPFEPVYEEVGRLRGFALAEDVVFFDPIVYKRGRTTGFTCGTITAVDMNVSIRCTNGKISRFKNQIEIRSSRGPFSLPGDSGSLVYSPSGLAVGLLFAGSITNCFTNAGGTKVTYANPIEHVLEKLDLEILF